MHFFNIESTLCFDFLMFSNIPKLYQNVFQFSQSNVVDFVHVKMMRRVVIVPQVVNKYVASMVLLMRTVVRLVVKNRFVTRKEVNIFHNKRTYDFAFFNSFFQMRAFRFTHIRTQFPKKIFVGILFGFMYFFIILNNLLLICICLKDFCTIP